ncbi:hypothetical protein QYE76_023011 [Lolium multiflorum]|uniref:Uncharacterized protein n=1 Tax=Lolium multiflorum TaxID=4521 RepID=A0AAD8VSE1_LOLMU|nr:hypothetical protein QYE76_023011 [Lolium multiflorum]
MCHALPPPPSEFLLPNLPILLHYTAGGSSCVFVIRSQRYALDVNVERVEDMVTHQRLLEEARYLQHRLSLEVGVVQIAEILSKLQIKEGAKRDCDVGWLQNKKVYNVLQQQ